MTKKIPLLLQAVILSALVLLAGCSEKNQTSEPASNPYISGYTSGLISKNGSIQVELSKPVSDIVRSQIKGNLFSLSPKVKGQVIWKNDRLIEFKPDKPLRSDKDYTVTFHLDKIYEETDKNTAEFTFQIKTYKQDFDFFADHFKPIDENSNKWVSVDLELTFADDVEPQEALAILSAKLDGKHKAVRFVSSRGRTFSFLIDSIERIEKSQMLSIEANGSGIDVKKTEKAELEIYAKDQFIAIAASYSSYPERCIKIQFTDALALQDLSGLITIPGAVNPVSSIEKNTIIVYAESFPMGDIEVIIHEGIKNKEGFKFKKRTSFFLNIRPNTPQVRLLKTGNILPNSQNLLLPFEAVNVKAVELRIIQIFDQNIPTFLQVNNLSGQNELTRHGRLIAKKILWLNQDRTKNLSNWNTYTLDISKLIEKAPGSIYRLELIVTQDYSIYPCRNEQAKPTEQSLPTSSEEDLVLTDQDFSAWDQPQGYYSPIQYDWTNYNWQERNNPCHPTYYMQDERLVSINILSSNIGIIAKKGSSGELFVSVQDIRTTQPLNNATVNVYNYQLQSISSTSTNSDGFTTVRLKNEPFLVEVIKGDDKGYLKVNNGNELSLSRFDVSGKTVAKGLKGFIYGERGVWRPGDEVFLTFILEDKQKSIPAGHPVTMSIYTPTGQFYKKLVNTNGLDNFYTFIFQTEEQDPTGQWPVRIDVGGASFEKSIRIETIKPNRLKINFNINEKIIAASKQRENATIKATWLHGAVARNLKTKVNLKLNPGASGFKGYENYVFRNPTVDFNYDEQMIFSGHLNENGESSFGFHLPQAQEAPGLLTATFTSSVEESGGGESYTINSYPYSPFPAYVGLHTHQSNNEILMTDTVHYFDVVMLNAEGKPIPQARLDYKVYKLDWSWWWDGNPNEMNSVISISNKKTYSSQTVYIKNGKARISLKIPDKDWGRYLIYIKDNQGGHATGKAVYFDAPYWGGRSLSGDPQGITMMTFSTDKEEYQVGEKVEVNLPKGSEGRILVSLENGARSLKQWWVNTEDQKETKISFDVTADLAPNFYIHLTRIQPHLQTMNDMPIRMYGVLPVKVNHKESVLHPVISMKDVLRPEEPFTINVSEKNKKDMTYTLAIVDDGLLDLTAFKTPNPWENFNAREALGVRTFDLYDQIIGAFAGELKPLYSIGGDEYLNPNGKSEQRFKPVVKFIGPFRLDKGKTNKHQLTLPPYIGSVRVMVVAANEAEQRYGKAEKTVSVQNPLMILSTLPRVLGPNEDVMLPVNVFVNDLKYAKVNVQVETNGLLEMKEGSSKQVSFQKVGEKTLFFSMKTKNKIGQETVVIKANSGKESFSETIHIQIRNPNPVVNKYVTATLQAGESKQFNYEFDQQLPENSAILEVSRIPSVNLSKNLDYLMSYPHGCSEQITSKAFPQLFLDKFVSLTSEQKNQLQEQVEFVIKKLYTLQTAEGGLAYWSGSSQINDWVTSYAGHFLASAKDKGYDVSNSFIKDWTRYQKQKSASWQKSSHHDDDLQQAYRLYTLAVMGSPDLSSMNKMKEMENLSLQSQWLLAASYAVTGKKDIARQVIFHLKDDIAPYSSFNQTFGSNVRDMAIILQTYVLLDDMTNAMEIAKKISTSLNTDYFYSTQTTSWVILSMGQMAEKAGKGNIDFSWTYQNKKQKNVKTSNPVFQTALSPLALKGNVQITNQSEGVIHVSMTSRSKPLEDLSPAESRNLSIQTTFTDLNNQSFAIDQLKQGTDFIAKITVRNTSGTTAYTNLALTHILPSGWEIINSRLMQEDDQPSRQTGDLTYQDIRDDRVLSYFDLAPGKEKTIRIRLQAAYLGRFFMPSVYCEAMYDHSVYARTQGRWVAVVE